MGSDGAEIRSPDRGAQAVGDSLGNVLQKKETVPAKTGLKALQKVSSQYDALILAEGRRSELVRED
jgi:hypothetical protein